MDFTYCPLCFLLTLERREVKFDVFFFFFFLLETRTSLWKHKVLTRMVYVWGFGISMIKQVETGTLQPPPYQPQHSHLLFMLREFSQKQMKASWYILGRNDKRRQVIRLAKIQKFDHLLGWQAVGSRKCTYCQ